MILAFIDEMRDEGYAVESVCRVLQGQGLKVAARTYRLWKQRGRKIADRTYTDATVLDAVRHACWTTVVCPDGTARPKMTPEGLYGRRKMLALIRRQISDASRGAVDRVCSVKLGSPLSDGEIPHFRRVVLIGWLGAVRPR